MNSRITDQFILLLRCPPLSSLFNHPVPSPEPLFQSWLFPQLSSNSFIVHFPLYPLMPVTTHSLCIFPSLHNCSLILLHFLTLIHLLTTLSLIRTNTDPYHLHSCLTIITIPPLLPRFLCLYNPALFPPSFYFPSSKNINTTTYLTIIIHQQPRLGPSLDSTTTNHRPQSTLHAHNTPAKLT